MGINIENELQNELEYALEKGEDELNERAKELCIVIEEIRRDLSKEDEE